MDFQELYSSCSSCSRHRREISMNKAEIVNKTQRVLDVEVGNSVYFVHLAQLGRGATHTVLVDYSDTYQEYKFCPLQGRPGSDHGNHDHELHTTSLVVTSDDCCDYKRITITERNGQLAVEREPRRVYNNHINNYPLGENLLIAQGSSAAVAAAPQVQRKQLCSNAFSICKRWIRLRIF